MHDGGCPALGHVILQNASVGKHIPPHFAVARIRIHQAALFEEALAEVGVDGVEGVGNPTVVIMD